MPLSRASPAVDGSVLPIQIGDSQSRLAGRRWFDLSFRRRLTGPDDKPISCLIVGIANRRSDEKPISRLIDGIVGVPTFVEI
ncbi:hypothetical protein U1Q18_043981 [Sarracenia purpurea var. burkii]